MASMVKDNINVQKAPIEVVDLLRESQTAERSYDAEPITIKLFHPTFNSIVGEQPTYSLLLSSTDSSRNPFFHNGCAYLPDQDQLYVTSDLLQSTSSSRLPVILISKLSFRRLSVPDSSSNATSSPLPVTSIEWMKLRPPPTIPMPAGAIPYEKGVLYCSQGNLEPNSGGLFYMPLGKRPVPIVTNYFKKPFNSIQSVIEDREGALWFTDPCIGYEQEIRPSPELPNHVYRCHPKTGELRVVADGFKRPTGITLSPDESVLYITDTDAARPGNMSSACSATIYAFDILRRQGTSPFLTNKHVFAFAYSGVPTAVKCDHAGNVYAACTDGVEVWSPGGIALGLIKIPDGGCSNLCFGRNGELFICGGQNLWRIQL
ncbi:hypothetical protein F5Y19DRAFT_365372 [Xylariaceae sp. FL1651]|nr:hypothetical protein F5Y19DRAFT_365372 [Xylariaceae sp. FL1651]